MRSDEVTAPATYYRRDWFLTSEWVSVGPLFDEELTDMVAFRFAIFSFEMRIKL